MICQAFIIQTLSTILCTQSHLTAKEIKARKLLQAYNNFLSGWVLKTAIKHYEENGLVIGTVSQIFSFFVPHFLIT